MELFISNTIALTTSFTSIKPLMPLQTSISDKYLVLPYSLLLVSGVQFIVSSIGLSSLILPNAATELTNSKRFTPLVIHAFTTFAVPSILVCCMAPFFAGLKDTTAAQWYTWSTWSKDSSSATTSKISPFTHSTPVVFAITGMVFLYNALTDCPA